MVRLSTTIFVCLALTAGAATLSLGAIQSERLSDVLNTLSERQRSTVAQALADQTHTVIQRELRAVEGLAMVVAARAPTLDSETVQPLLAAHRDRYGINELIVVGDAEGRGVVGDHTPPGGSVTGTDYSDRGYVRQVRSTGRSAVSPVEMGRRSGSPNIHLAAPIHIDGSFAGYVVTAMPLGRLHDAALRAVARTEGGRALILDSTSQIVVDTAAAPLRQVITAPVTPLLAAETSPTSVVRLGFDERGIAVAAGAIGVMVGDSPWTVLVLQPEEVLLAAAKSARRRTLLTAIAVLAASLLLALLLARWIARPISRLLDVAASVGAEEGAAADFSRGRFDPKEAVDLSRVLQDMLLRLRCHSDELERRVVERTQALEVARNQALEASHTKSAFIANMSHEIRTPMNGVLGMVQLLRDSVETDDQREYAEAAHASGKALVTLLNELLDVSKIESGAMNFEELPLDIADVVDDVTRLFNANAGAAGIEFLPRVMPSTPRCVIGDRGRIRQILTNLVGNALKFTASGHIGINVCGRRVGERVHLEFEVSDTGIGIPEDRHASIFAMFAQADASTTRQYGGTGLGLAIVQRLAELMGGDVSLKSTVGVGSTFKVHLDLPAADSQNQAPRHASPPEHPALIISGNPAPRAHLMAQLSDIGVAAQPVTNQDEAVAYLQQSPVSLVVMDVDLKLDLAALRRMAKGAPKFVAWARLGAADQRLPDSDAALRRPARLKRLIDLMSSDAESRQPPKPVHNKTSGRVLVVEDNRVNQRIVQRMLEGMGLTVALADDGVQGLKKIESEAYDLVLMDCQMPNMDGYEATRCIRAQAGLATLPIVALTANAMAEDRQRCLDAGMNDHITKPLTRNELRRAVDTWLCPAKLPSSRRAPPLEALKPAGNPPSPA